MKDGRGEVESVLQGKVYRIDGLRGHAPPFAIDDGSDERAFALKFRETATREVADDVIRFDFVVLFIPMVGVADADIERIELGDGLGLGCRRHPGNALETATIDVDEIGNHRLDLSFHFWRKVTLNVEVSQLAGKVRVSNGNRSPPAGLLERKRR